MNVMYHHDRWFLALSQGRRNEDTIIRAKRNRKKNLKKSTWLNWFDRDAMFEFTVGRFSCSWMHTLTHGWVKCKLIDFKFQKHGNLEGKREKKVCIFMDNIVISYSLFMKYNFYLKNDFEILHSKIFMKVKMTIFTVRVQGFLFYQKKFINQLSGS